MFKTILKLFSFFIFTSENSTKNCLIKEKVEIIKIHYSGKSFNKSAKIFNEKFPQSKLKPNHAYVSKLVKKFEETGSVLDRKRSGKVHGHRNALF